MDLRVPSYSDVTRMDVAFQQTTYDREAAQYCPQYLATSKYVNTVHRTDNVKYRPDSALMMCRTYAEYIAA